MSRDGLVPKIFSDVHPKYRSPYKSQWLFFIFVSLFAAFVPDSVVGDMTSIGTLFAFVLVCIGVIILRRKNPSLPRPFKTPLVPLIPLLGVAFCVAMIAGLGLSNWLRLFIWLAIGFVIYFFYSIKHSNLNSKKS
jgi:APA family basic amino acid/polyamine antiporter